MRNLIFQALELLVSSKHKASLYGVLCLLLGLDEPCLGQGWWQVCMVHLGNNGLGTHFVKANWLELRHFKHIISFDNVFLDSVFCFLIVMWFEGEII